MSKKKKANPPGEIVPFQATPPPVEFFDFLAMVEKLVMGNPIFTPIDVPFCDCPKCQAERAAAAAAREAEQKQTDETQSFAI